VEERSQVVGKDAHERLGEARDLLVLRKEPVLLRDVLKDTDDERNRVRPIDEGRARANHDLLGGDRAIQDHGLVSHRCAVDHDATKRVIVRPEEPPIGIPCPEDAQLFVGATAQLQSENLRARAVVDDHLAGGRAASHPGARHAVDEPARAVPARDDHDPLVGASAEKTIPHVPGRDFAQRRREVLDRDPADGRVAWRIEEIERDVVGRDAPTRVVDDERAFSKIRDLIGRDRRGLLRPLGRWMPYPSATLPSTSARRAARRLPRTTRSSGRATPAPPR
jgi:hypothetical protein